MLVPTVFPARYCCLVLSTHHTNYRLCFTWTEPTNCVPASTDVDGLPFTCLENIDWLGHRIAFPASAFIAYMAPTTRMELRKDRWCMNIGFYTLMIQLRYVTYSCSSKRAVIHQDHAKGNGFDSRSIQKFFVLEITLISLGIEFFVFAIDQALSNLGPSTKKIKMKTCFSIFAVYPSNDNSLNFSKKICKVFFSQLDRHSPLEYPLLLENKSCECSSQKCTG